MRTASAINRRWTIPIYDYRCPLCQERQEAYRKIDERITDAPFCECGSNEPMELLISPVMGFGDLPGYLSPVTEKWVEGRKARSEDLKRSGCRPYEGREQELKEKRRQQRYADEKVDKVIDRSVKAVLSKMDPDKRAVLFGD